MKTTWTGGLALAALLALPGLAQAQDKPAEKSLEQKLADKLAEPWITKADWLQDYDQVRAKAKESGKFIFAYFTRSYAP